MRYIDVFSCLKKIFCRNSDKENKKIIDKKNWNNNLNEICVFDCMTPTKDLLLINVKSTFQELIREIQIKNQFFALLYNNNSDDLVGVIYESDIIQQFVTNNKKDGCDFLFSDIFFVPYVMDINLAVKNMFDKNSNISAGSCGWRSSILSWR